MWSFLVQKKVGQGEIRDRSIKLRERVERVDKENLLSLSLSTRAQGHPIKGVDSGLLSSTRPYFMESSGTGSDEDHWHTKRCLHAAWKKQMYPEMKGHLQGPLPPRQDTCRKRTHDLLTYCIHGGGGARCPLHLLHSVGIGVESHNPKLGSRIPHRAC